MPHEDDVFNLLEGYSDDSEVDSSDDDEDVSTSTVTVTLLADTGTPEETLRETIVAACGGAPQPTAGRPTATGDAPHVPDAQAPPVTSTGSTPAGPAVTGEITCQCSSTCYRQFDQDDLLAHVLTCAELTVKELDYGVQCKLEALTNTSSVINSNHRTGTPRKQPVTVYMHQGRKVCRQLFMRIHGIGKDRLNALRKHSTVHGMIPREKRTGGRTKLAITMEQRVQINTFIIQYSEEFGMRLAGRVPGQLLSLIS